MKNFARITILIALFLLPILLYAQFHYGKPVPVAEIQDSVGLTRHSENNAPRLNHSSIIKLVEKAEVFFKTNRFLFEDYYLVELSEDENRVTKKNEKWYQVWAKNDSIVPNYAGVAISSTGKIVKITTPITLKALAKKSSKPTISLKNALLHARDFAIKNGLVKETVYFNAAYLIIYQDSVQYWHILGNNVSVFVCMDGSVEKTTSL